MEINGKVNFIGDRSIDVLGNGETSALTLVPCVQPSDSGMQFQFVPIRKKFFEYMCMYFSNIRNCITCLDFTQMACLIFFFQKRMLFCFADFVASDGVIENVCKTLFAMTT